MTKIETTKYYQLFLNYLKLHNYTLDNYNYKIRLFLRFCEANNINPCTISFNEMSTFFIEVQAKWKSGYINNLLLAIRFFYKCLLDNQLISTDFISLVYKFKLKPTERKIKDYITEEELKEILEMGMSFCEQIDPYKLEVIMYLLFYTGIRRGEFLNLKRNDFDLPNNKAKIRIPTKNREERWIYFPRDITILIEKYFQTEDEGYNAFNITVSQLVFIMKQLKEFLKNKNLTPHSLRHSFARMLAEKEVDIKTAQKLLGHKNISTTEIYFDPDDRIVEKNYRSKVKIKIK